MPADKRPGKKGMYVELPADLDAKFRAFVERFPLGTITQHIQLAIRRHMADPPTVDVPKLGPARMEAPPEKPAKRGRGKKS
jgi:hypothetical protein